MRGIPGSGKTYTARTLAPSNQIFSTDEYWGPEYKFDITKLFIAHNWNKERVQKAMVDEVTPIVVDNTNVTQREMSPYIVMAKRYGYFFQFVEPTSWWWLEFLKDLKLNPSDVDKHIKYFAKINVHKVPEQVIKNMISKWQFTENIVI